MLGLLSDFEEAGLYNIAAQGGGLVMLALSISNTITVPHFARLHSAGDLDAFQRFAIMSARVGAAIGVATAIVHAIFGEFLLVTIFGATTAAAFGPLLILAIGYAVAMMFGAPGFILNMSGHEKVALRIIAYSAALNVVLNAVAIPLAGASGAALATSTSLLMQRLAMHKMVRKHVGISSGILR